MIVYQIQFQSINRRWRGGPTIQMVPGLLREFLNHLTDIIVQRKFGAQSEDDYRVIRTKCTNPQYQYNGAQNIIDLRDIYNK